MVFAKSNDTVGINDEQGPVRDPTVLVEYPQGLRDAPVGPEVGQQRVANTAHGERPCLQSKDGIHTQAQNLGIHFSKLCQRTVERGSLVGSATRKGERKGVQHYPFTTVLGERDLLTIVAFELEIGCRSSGV